MRTVPVVLEIAERVRELAAPDAWIVDFTNPVGIVTRALLDEGHRAVGLCNVAIGLQRRLAALLEVDARAGRGRPGRAQPPHLGAARCCSTVTTCCPTSSSDTARELGEHVGLRPRLLDELGAIPSYYLRYFYCHDAVLAEQRVEEPRAAAVARIEEELLEIYRDPEVSEKPALLEQARRRVLQRGGDCADRVARRRDGRRAGRRRAQRDDGRRARARRRRRAARADRGRGRRAARAAAARARAARPRPARRRLRAARGRGGAHA